MPIGQLGLQHLAGELLALPRGEVSILNLQRGKRRLLAAHSAAYIVDSSRKRTPVDQRSKAMWCTVRSSTPARIAARLGDRQITYGELDARANRLASALRELRVRRDTLVGLFIDRSLELLVGMLAILKAGGAYVPIDPAYPQSRVDFLLADSAAAVVVSVAGLAERLREAKALVVLADDAGLAAGAVDSGPIDEARDSDLAYVIYTSGTTGNPKGVLIEHRSVVRLLTQTSPWYAFGPTDVWTLFHSPSFDVSVWEIWGALLYGGTLIIVPQEIVRSPEEFGRLLRAEKVTILNQTPSAFRQLMHSEASLQHSAELALRLVIFAGEKLEPQQLAPWVRVHGDTRPELVNMYGITETTVHVTYRPLTAEEITGGMASVIGRPIPDLQICLFDPAGAEVAEDTPGEIYVTGPGLARGYLNRPALTAERFVWKPSAEGTPVRFYRSGDLAIRRPDGDLLFLGRIDDQLKVRGFRIEPAEVEACLLGQAGVHSAVVLARDFGEGDVRLVAFVIPLSKSEDEARLAQALRDKAARELPEYMRPSATYFIPMIPLTAHGKVDRQALLRQAAETAPAHGASETSGTATEQVIAEIAAEILQQPVLRVSDELLAMGATSLALVRILWRVNQHFGVTLGGAELAGAASVARLAGQVEAQLLQQRG